MCVFAGSEWDRYKAQPEQFRMAPASLLDAVTAQRKEERLVAESWCPNIAARRRHAEQMGLVCPPEI